MALGGLSGSGKSTVAARLAPLLGSVPGAVIVSSDVVRKQLEGVPLERRLPASAYTADAKRRVYAAMSARAAAVLATGRPAIVDAVHARSEDRDAIAAVAARAGVPFVGLWLDARPEEQAARIRARAGGASDATVAVLDAQRAQQLGTISWPRIDTTGPPSAVATLAREVAPQMHWRPRNNAHQSD